MSRFTETITVTSYGREITLHVKGDAWPEEPQTWDCPGEPAGYEVSSVWHDGDPQDDEHDVSGELTDEEAKALVEAVGSALQASAEAATENAAVARYEARMADRESGWSNP
jgi:hypothetical protein